MTATNSLFLPPARCCDERLQQGRRNHPGENNMIHNNLGEDYETWRKTVETFANKEVAPVIGDFYERHAFPYDIVAKMAEMGMFALPFDEEYGGSGGDFFAVCLAVEELARVDSSVAVTLEAGLTLGVMPIYRFGTEEQKKYWLPKLTSGKMLGAFGLTEPGAGSDASNTKTRAVREGDEWVINGSKAYITNAGSDITGLITVAAVTGADDDGKKQISTIIVPSGTPGLTVAKGYSKVGWCVRPTATNSGSTMYVCRSRISLASSAVVTLNSSRRWMRAA